jgi:DNA polymerase-3 subunit beta
LLSGVLLCLCFYLKEFTMYVTVGQKALKTAVSTVQTIAGTGRTQLPILKHLLLVADATGLRFCASNEETSIQYRLQADVQASGTALLPAHLFSRFVQDLPAAPITLVLPSPTDPTAVQVRCQSVKANIRIGAMPSEEFPRISHATDGCRDLLTVDCELLREIIDQVAFAAGTDPSRPVLEGIRVAFASGRASFGAADAFRLAVRSIALPDPQVSAEVIIPAQTMRQVARLLPASGAVRIALSPSGHQALFHTQDMDLSTRLVEGTFPDFRPLLSIQAATRVVLPTHVLAAAVQLMVPFARENQHQLRLQTLQERPGEAAALVLEAEAPDLGANEMRLTESVTVTDPDLRIQVNEGWLAETLAAVSTPQVALEFTDAARPIVVRPVSPLDGVYVIMPLYVRPMPASAPEPQGVSVPDATAAR